MNCAATRVERPDARGFQIGTGRFDEAAEWTALSFERAPTYVENDDILGEESWLISGRLDEAEATNRQALALAPTDSVTQTTYARILQAKGQHDEAVKALEAFRATEIGGKSVGAALATADLYLDSPNSQAGARQAQHVYREVIAQHPANITAHMGLARAAHALDESDMAEQAYRRVLELEPHNWRALNDLAWMLAHNRDGEGLSEAAVLADTGVAQFPNNVHLLDTRGVVFFKRGRLDQAREDLEKCVRLAGGQHATRASALLHLARVLVKIEGREAARSALLDAQRVDEVHHVLSEEQRAEIARMLDLP